MDDTCLICKTINGGPELLHSDIPDDEWELCWEHYVLIIAARFASTKPSLRIKYAGE